MFTYSSVPTDTYTLQTAEAANGLNQFTVSGFITSGNATTSATVTTASTWTVAEGQSYEFGVALPSTLADWRGDNAFAFTDYFCFAS